MGTARTKYDKRKYPLRKVVERDVRGDYNDIPNRRLNLLECGHKIPCATDFYGQIFSAKQRCRECYITQTNTCRD